MFGLTRFKAYDGLALFDVGEELDLGREGEGFVLSAMCFVVLPKMCLSSCQH
jgi:hypothetical protein